MDVKEREKVKAHGERRSYLYESTQQRSQSLATTPPLVARPTTRTT